MTETAAPGNRAPELREVTVDPSRGRKANARERLAFAAVAEDADGEDLTYSWAFGDGTLEEGASVTHRFRSKGVYKVVLTVTDGTETVRLRLLVDVKRAQRARR